MSSVFRCSPPAHWFTSVAHNSNIPLFKKLFPDLDRDYCLLWYENSLVTLNGWHICSASLRLLSILRQLGYTPSKTQQLRLLAVVGASKESFLFMASSAYLSANHCICFEDLSANAIADRLGIFDPHFVFTSSSCKNKVIDAISLCDVSPSLVDFDSVFSGESDCNPDELLNHYSSAFSYSSEDSLFTLFTSGTTGKPKGIVHSCQRYITSATSTAREFFSLTDDSVILTATDAGWINGHTYAFYGPLLCRSKTVICSDLTQLSSPDNLVKILSQARVTCFYCSVTLLRALKRASASIHTLSNCSLSALNSIGSCGEPLADDVGNWAIKFFKPYNKFVVNTYFQTETGSVLIAPKSDDIPILNSSTVGLMSNCKSLSFAGDVLTSQELQDQSIEPDELLVTKPWDGIFQHVISDRPVEYFTRSGFYRLFDVGYLDSNGYLYIGGRSDDVMNIAGHRISTSEIESVVLKIPGVYEACVVEVPDEITGSSLVLFYSSTDIVSDTSFTRLIDAHLSIYHRPSLIYRFNGLPKTKSGKILRRVMRSLAKRGCLTPNVDTSTFTDTNSFISSFNSFFPIWFNKTTSFLNSSEIRLPTLTNFLSTSLAFPELSSQICLYLCELFSSSVSTNLDSQIILTFRDDSSICRSISFSLQPKMSLLTQLNTHLSTPLDEYKLTSCPDIFSFSFSSSSGFDALFYFRIDHSRDLLLSYTNVLAPSSVGVDHLFPTDLESISGSCNYSEAIPTPSSHQSPQISDSSSQVQFECHICHISLNFMQQLRGDSSFFTPIILANGSKAFICSLCSAGWH